MIWFLEKIPRLQKERNSINLLISEVDWLVNVKWTIEDGRLCIDCDIVIGEKTFPMRVIYPSQFPATPPIVVPRGEGLHWSSHQYGYDGELCLEWGSDTWHESICAADVIRSTYKLLSLENSTTSIETNTFIPSRHELEQGQELRRTVFRFVLNSTAKDYLYSLQSGAIQIANFGLLFSHETLTVFLLNIELSNSEKWFNKNIPPELGSVATTITGKIYRPQAVATALTPSTLVSFLQNEFDLSNELDQGQLLTLVFDVSMTAQLFWRTTDDKYSKFTTIEIIDESENLRLVPESKLLSQKKVGVVGVGSVGSKISISLARTGVRNFILVDHDIFLPENICRHELTWLDVGQHKVDAIAHEIGLVLKDANVQRVKLKLSGQESSAGIDSAFSRLAECDLIIDATGDSSTFNQLSYVASQQKKAMIWLEVLAGGIGGIVARYRPGKDPTPNYMRSFLSSYLEKKPKSDLTETQDYTAHNVDGQVIVASDADVAFITSTATRMALDLLLEHEPLVFPFSMYLIGLAREWIFHAPFHTIPIEFEGWEALEDDEDISNIDTADTLSFLTQLINRQKNEDPTAS